MLCADVSPIKSTPRNVWLSNIEWCNTIDGSPGGEISETRVILSLQEGCYEHHKLIYSIKAMAKLVRVLPEGFGLR